MPCIICEQSPGAYELVEHVPPTENREGAVAAEVCAQCAEEFLLVNRTDPTCAFCDTPGEYDLIEDVERGRDDAGIGDDSVGRAEGVAAERVVCEEHLRDLESGDEGPGGQAPAQGQDESADEEADTEEPVDTDEEEREGATDAEQPAETDEETANTEAPAGGDGEGSPEQEQAPDQEPEANPDATERQQRPGGDGDGDGDRDRDRDRE